MYFSVINQSDAIFTQTENEFINDWYDQKRTGTKHYQKQPKNNEQVWFLMLALQPKRRNKRTR